MKPSGTLLGGGAGVTPSVLHVPSSSSQYWQLSSMLQFMPMNPDEQSQRPLTHVPAALDVQ